MPLVKNAQKPAATPATEAPAQAAAPQTHAPKAAAKESRNIQPATLDAKSRQIQRQGAFQAALQSVGVVQHGGKTFADYLARVREAADAELGYINE
jgi:hypothetical protein